MIPHLCRPSILQAILSADNLQLSGSAEMNIVDHCAPLATTEDVNPDLVAEILDVGLRRLRAGELDLSSSLDQWLAPRVHSALRISRRLAGDMTFWTWLVLRVGREYTYTRWGSAESKPTMYRYNGDFKRNSLARLWWFAEMSRNGPDYGPIKDVLRDASTAQYALELRYSMYKPALIAFGSVAQHHKLGFSDLKDLSKRANAYLSLRSLEGLGLDSASGIKDAEWWNEKPTIADLITDDIRGPNDGLVSKNAIVHLEEWLESLVAEASKTRTEKGSTTAKS